MKISFSLLAAFAVLALSSCAPIGTHSVSQAKPTPYESRTYANVAIQGLVKASAGVDSGLSAIDGDIDTWWSAEDFAPQWLEIRLPYAQPVGKIELIVTQASPGPATHRVKLELAEEVVAWHRFDTELSADGHLFALKIEPPKYIDKLGILTTRNEGWVAWREVRILRSALLSESVSGLSNPVQLTHARDGSGRIFVVERTGQVRIVKNGALVATPFLDISERVLSDNYDEQGLLNIAFPPSYSDHRRFYVSYTDKSGDTTISRFASSTDPDIADPASEEIVLTIEQPGIEHNGGTIMFGPLDGYLYIASGDGEGSNKENMPQNAQDPGTLLGKILRIDVESGVKPYAIPPDNPFVALPGHAPEIWAMGLRNPWGVAFDQQSGDFYIPDVGWFTNEEVNFQPADSGGGENYGWPLLEGVVPLEGEGASEGFVMPVAVYERRDGCAVVGGAVSNGQFFYGDFCTARIWSLRRQENGEWQDSFLMNIGVPLSGIGVDESGRLYALGYLDGKIYPLMIESDSE